MADRIGYNGSDKWKIKATELLNEGGGGSEVTPNPQGQATDVLTKIEIDGDIYSIPSGGSGNVADVYVNGSSVLDSNHIAQIKTHRAINKTQYDALSVSEKQNGMIYFVTPNISSDYVFHTASDGTIVIRENQTLNEKLCFFCGFDNTLGDYPIPSEVSLYIPANYFGYAPNYPDAGTTQDGWGGFYSNNIRMWSQDLGQVITGVMWGVVDLNSSTIQQVTQYSDPYAVLEGEFAIYYMGDKYTSEVIANPQEQATDALDTISIDGVVYSIAGGGDTEIIVHTTAEWQNLTSLVSKKGGIYIWSDYKTENNVDIPALKIGDGLAYVVDLPFATQAITLSQIQSWNNKVSARVSGENLILEN